MEKTRKCLVEKGIFIGTIFTKNIHEKLRIFLQKMGAHFYEGEKEFVIQLLTESEFSVEKIEQREEEGFRFMARKTTFKNVTPT